MVEKTVSEPSERIVILDTSNTSDELGNINDLNDLNENVKIEEIVEKNSQTPVMSIECDFFTATSLSTS